MYQDDIDYAIRRLDGTLVRLLDGNPFYISRTAIDANGDVSHCGTQMVSGDEMWVKHQAVDLTPVPLGFVNTRSSMVFVCRKPMRRDWHQGLHRQSIKTYGNLSALDLNIKLLNQPILKQYPNFTQAVAGLEKKESVAFSRDFGVKNSLGVKELVYRSYAVGKIEGGRPTLFQDKFFLEQHLSEAVG